MAARTFRVFISSTFSDLKAERNALQAHVFPRLRELCQQHGARFQPIDLRWGVSEEASLDQQAMNICLGEIARCQQVTPRPNFIILLGDRYGWRPLPPEIPRDEFEKILAFVPDSELARLCWQAEQPTGQKGWYRLDANARYQDGNQALQGIYILQARTGRFIDYATWEEEVERPLGALLERAASQAGLGEDALLKYTRSATEQEIIHGALSVSDAHEHVFCFFRHIENLPQDQRAEGYVDRDANDRLDLRAAQKLAALKSNLEKILQQNVHHFTTRWHWEGMSNVHIGKLPVTLAECLPLLGEGYAPKNLCEAVWCSIARIIQKEISALEAVDPLEQEVEAHTTFAQERARVFVGRLDPLAAIASYLAGVDVQPRVVWGESGSGKSALLAKALQQATANLPAADIVYRFIGATPGSTNARALLESLCRQITRLHGGDEASIPSQYQELVQDFPRRLSLASPRKPLLIFIDALDQLSRADNARNLAWLPSRLPTGVRLVVSTLSGECLQALERKLPAQSFCELQPMSLNQGEALLDLWLEDCGRTLQPDQRREIIHKFNTCRLPLYLKLAFEEARLWRSYTPCSSLSDHIPGVIQDLFSRLSAESHHGALLVSHALGYLASARNGLSEDEMLDVLSRDQAVMADFLRRSPKSPIVDRLPVVVWSRLFFDLEPYLSKRSADGTTLLNFYHPTTFVPAVRERVLGEGVSERRHRALAAYFKNQPLTTVKGDLRTTNLRKLSELPFQQAEAGLWPDLQITLSDFDFLQAKVRAVGPQPLIEDYDHARAAGYSEPDLFAIQDALRLCAHMLVRDDGQLAGQLVGRLLDQEAPAIQYLVGQARAWKDSPWLQPQTQSLTLPGGALLRTLTGHLGKVMTVAFHPDGKRIISGATDGLIKIWDSEGGALLGTIGDQQAMLKDMINTLLITPDGQILIYGGHLGQVTLRNFETGQYIDSLGGSWFPVEILALFPDGKRAVYTQGSQITIFEIDSRKVLETLEGPQGSARALAIMPGGQRIATAVKNKVTIWDLARGTPPVWLVGHTQEVNAVIALPNGMVVSGSKDNTIKVWDASRGVELFSLQGHNSWVTTLAALPGERIISGSSDMTLKLWDLKTREEICTLRGHTHTILSLAVSPGGRKAVSGSWDGTLKVWDLAAGTELPGSRTSENPIFDIAMIGDGSRAISSSNDATLKVWEVHNGAISREMVSDSIDIRAVAVSVDSQRVISGSEDGYLAYWDLASGQLLHRWQAHQDAVRSVGILLNGREAISCSNDHTLRIWDLGDFSETFVLKKDAEICDMILCEDGRKLIFTSEDYTLNFLDLQTRQWQWVYKGQMPIQVAALSPDAQRIVFAGCLPRNMMSRAVRVGQASEAELRSLYALTIWDPATQQALFRLEGHLDLVTGLAFIHPHRVVSSSFDGTIKAWDLETRQVLASYTCDFAPLCCTAVPGTNQILVGDSGGWLHVLRLVT